MPTKPAPRPHFTPDTPTHPSAALVLAWLAGTAIIGWLCQQTNCTTEHAHMAMMRLGAFHTPQPTTKHTPHTPQLLGCRHIILIATTGKLCEQTK